MDRDPRLFSRAENVFADWLIENPEADETAFVAFVATHPELGEELSALRRQWRLFQSTQARLVSASVEPASDGHAAPALARRVGGFELVRILGRGGMGEVWEAVEVGLKRRVALKLLSPTAALSVETRARFQREAEATGRLSAPGIVSVFRAGEADGRCYIAYELVEGGRSLRNWIDDRAREPELPERHHREVAELIAAVADALAFAHEAGVVHRDLKPQNVLIDVGGRPKVADFGLAKVAGELSLSRTGAFVGTWLYASPEQVGGESAVVDARSDVFSLGVTLYECLTLRRPFDGDTEAQVRRAILNDEPTDPRVFRSRCPRDLATIALFALEKRPERRYPSMRAFAADLRRHLANEPVQARAPRLDERLAKWTRRHPTAATAIALGAAALIATSVLYLQAESARRSEADTNSRLGRANDELIGARNDAQRAAADASRDAATARAEAASKTRIVEFVTGLFESADPAVSGERVPSVRELVDRGFVSVRTDSTLEPAIRARLLRTLARLVGTLGDFPESARALDEARAIFATLGPDEASEALRADHDRGAVAFQLGDYELAEALLAPIAERAKENAGCLGDPGPVEMQSLAKVYTAQGRYEEARVLLETAAESALSRFGRDAAETVGIELDLLTIHYLRADWTRAMQLVIPLAAVSQPALERGEPNALGVYNLLALILHELGKFAEAERVYGDLVVRCSRVYDWDHPDFSTLRQNLAREWQSTGRLELAEALYREELELCARRTGPRAQAHQVIAHNLATCLLDAHRPTEAEPVARELWTLRRELLGEDAPDTLLTQYVVARALHESGRNQDALELAEDLVRRTPADDYELPYRRRLVEDVKKSLGAR